MKTNRTEWSSLLLQTALLVFMSLVTFTVFKAVGIAAYTLGNMSILLIGAITTATAVKMIKQYCV